LDWALEVFDDHDATVTQPSAFDGPRICREETSSAAKERCLPRVRRANDGDDFAAPDLQMHVIERASTRGAIGETDSIHFAQRLDAEHRRCCQRYFRVARGGYTTLRLAAVPHRSHAKEIERTLVG